MWERNGPEIRQLNARSGPARTAKLKSRDVHRALASSLLSVLLLTTLLWGGCISCEQFFMFPGAKSCCQANGRCDTKRPQQSQAGRDCKQIAFEHQRSADVDLYLPEVAVLPSDVPPLVAERLTRPSGLSRIYPSPPDLQALHSTFLI